MPSEKEQYEQIIRRSILFSLDRDREPAAYQRECLRMIESLYCFLMAVSKKKYENYGLEITETAKRCIKAFDPDKGDFLRYFLSAWRREYSHIKRDEALSDQLHGIRISEDDRRNLARYLKLVNTAGTQPQTPALYEKLALAMGITADEVRQIAELSSVRVNSDISLDHDGNEVSAWDFIPVDHTGLEGIEEEFDVEHWLQKIENAYLQLQARQKPIVSDLITVKICGSLSVQPVMAERYSFFSKEVLLQWKQDHSIPSQRDLAAKYGKQEASLSRTLRQFCEKISFPINQSEKSGA